MIWKTDLIVQLPSDCLPMNAANTCPLVAYKRNAYYKYNNNKQHETNNQNYIFNNNLNVHLNKKFDHEAKRGYHNNYNDHGHYEHNSNYKNKEKRKHRHRSEDNHHNKANNFNNDKNNFKLETGYNTYDGQKTDYQIDYFYGEKEEEGVQYLDEYNFVYNMDVLKSTCSDVVTRFIGVVISFVLSFACFLIRLPYC